MIRKVSTPIEEQETFIYLAPLEADNKAVIYTTEPAMLKTMRELYKKYPEGIELKSDDKYGSEFYIPSAWIIIKPKKMLTDAQRKELASRFHGNRKKARQKKK